MKRAIILQHLDGETAGRIAILAQATGLSLDVRNLHLGAPVPDRVGPDEILVVMGGPMGVADVGDARYPYLAAELALLRRALADGSAVLGVCLGSQLLAAAAGARVYINRDPQTQQPLREVGFAPIGYLGVGREPVLAGLREEELVFQWHGDTFDLPPGAVHLASSDKCRHQAFRIGSRAFGLQFHVEVDAEMARRWAADDPAYVISALGPDGPAQIIASAEEDAARMREPADRLMRNLLCCMLG
jgi:GMP synthase-like glutamine amidotransferase